MSTIQNPELEALYKQFDLGTIPIFQNKQSITIQRLFKVLTRVEFKNLITVEAMNFYLYCNFFKNRLIYSEVFNKNLAYLNSKVIELKERIKETLEAYDEMLLEIKSESDITWIDNNIITLNDGLLMLDSIPTRCDYYDNKIFAYLKSNKNDTELLAIEAECAKEFAKLSNLFAEVGRLIGR